MKITMIDRIGLVPYSQLDRGEAFQKVDPEITMGTIFFKSAGSVIVWLDGHWLRQGQMSDPNERVRPVKLVEIVIQTCESHRDADHEIRE